MLFRMIFLIVMAAATPAGAHDWYPIECCHSLDCAPVDKAEVIKGPAHASMLSLPQAGQALAGGLMVTSRHGTAFVPDTLPRRESKDNRMHVCMRPSSSGGMRVICVFLPPPM